jgi:hypothetical protein
LALENPLTNDLSEGDTRISEKMNIIFDMQQKEKHDTSSSRITMAIMCEISA